MRWLDRDGMHPGPDLTLLMAVLLYRELRGVAPPTTDIVVHAPIYGVRSGLNARDFASRQRPDTSTKASIVYSADALREVVELTTDGCARPAASGRLTVARELGSAPAGTPAPTLRVATDELTPAQSADNIPGELPATRGATLR
jgi:hypothetical protein